MRIAPGLGESPGDPDGARLECPRAQPVAAGLVFVNPPYGVRIGEVGDLEPLYALWAMH